MLNQHQGVAPLVLFMLAVDQTFAQLGERPYGRPYTRFRNAFKRLREDVHLPDEADENARILLRNFNRLANDQFGIEDLIYDFEEEILG